MLNIEPGIHTMQICDDLNTAIHCIKYQIKYKKRRKLIRHLCKQNQDKNIEVEGTSYEAGSF